MATIDASRSIRDDALARVSAGHLHQCLWLPETQDHPRLRVTFATTSNFDDKTLPAILFIPPMFGSRWFVLEMDKLARESGVRVVFPDRPGMGGSTPVSLDIRMQVWLETVPVLLRKVNVQHISIVTHSAGGVYTLNTLAKLRSILDPKAPYVALLGTRDTGVGFVKAATDIISAPWVPAASSNVTLMNLASKIPSPVIDQLSSLQGFVMSKIAPTLSFSGGLISSSAALVGSKPDANTEVKVGSDEHSAEKYGVDVGTAKLISSHTVKFHLAEDTTAGNEEAKLCLMKGGGASWGVLANYEACVRSIADEQGANSGDGKMGRLRVDAFFAASDLMIGKGGQEYFEKCWRQEGMADKVHFDSQICEGTDHDSVLVDFRLGALRKVFEKIATLGATA